MNEENKLRTATVEALEALENLMIQTGDKKTPQEKAIWRSCYPLWVTLQKEVRRMPR